MAVAVVQRIRLSYSKYWYAYAMIAPVVIVLGVLVGYPLVRGIYLTLTNATSLNVGRQIGVNHIPDSFDFIGLDNYADVLWGPTAYDRFWSHFIWTVAWTAICVVLHYSIGLALALLLNRKMRGRGLYRLVLILPWAVPTFVTVFSWRLMLADGGAVNGLLGFLHLPEPGWLSDPLAQKAAAILVNTWVGVPFMMISLLGGLQSIPQELYEAAEMDGASPWQRFRYVTLPGLRTVSSTVVLLGVIWTFNQFAVIFLLFGSGAPDAQILVTWAYRLGFGQQPSDYAQSATYGILLLSILIVFTSFYRRWLARNEKANG
ncbi:sugar ABC transporter permease [Kitasatospora cineracea]|uniref:Carbohydrate ABC transporter membrane protein 1 (CUT1 family) n=1 Tax=Kitasatospora cineracea TaxID=88074 RepID=A0A3N4RX00_9ACTN|nr:sugar ABC transporter permease [Kitasatospora cineracea]ROR45239.1 carbohydrate ABC transporter membrane protein 1 (CUT1 family) [Kitasatospora cineracea]RPE35591.1 carbohydrate ABC transporter membrane protein 1 (CUT1 family) [Kitasatospora cineracea]